MRTQFTVITRGAVGEIHDASGQDLGVKLSYIVREKPDGLADACILGEKFLGSGGIAYVLGDNTSQGQGSSPASLCYWLPKQGEQRDYI